MKRALCAVTALILGVSAAPVEPQSPAWSAAQVAQLRRLALAAPEDALPVPAAAELDAAERGGDPATINRAATALALRLARMHLMGCATSSERSGWRIVDTDRPADLAPRLAQALAADGLDRFFAELRPADPDYAALRAAFATETDPARRDALARNMERWRWMPQSLGPDHVLVNTAAFEASLWRGGQRVGVWPVIVGKPSTPSPVFSATITGVNFNPWWDVPASIIRERGGVFPSRQGYVHSAGRVRQRPGPNNALGLMKLVMPNPFSVYLHDTPNRTLFSREVRAFSHGCIRVGDALGFATALLAGVRTREDVDRTVAAGQTVTVDLAAPLPVHIAYFTAGLRTDGTLAFYPDIYRRDGRLGDATRRTGAGCGAGN